MAFTVEDGTKVVGANSLATTAYVDAYFTERGEAAWTGSATVKQQALVKATDYFEKRFGAILRGSRQFTDQELSWPRKYVVTTDGVTIAESTVPDLIKRAISEYALVALVSGKIVPDPPRPGSSTFTGEVKSQSVQVGPISKSTTYASRAERRTHPLSTNAMVTGEDFPVIPAADLLVEKFLKAGGAGGGVIR